jgi:glycosyltransferase involved in cell wall biosynthesis
VFKKGFKNIESLELKTIHLGKPYQKWNKVEINKDYIKGIKGVSVIIPAYKATKFIKECLESILLQKLNNDIVVEINIGIDSCEETLNYIKGNKFIYNNCNIFYFEENGGPYLIRNTLSKLCKYENIIYFDADDIMDIELINETFIKLIEYDVVRWKFINFYGNFNDGDFKLNDWHAHGVFGIKKDIFLSMNGFSPWRIGSDTEFLERSKKFKVKTFYTEKIMFYRRQHDDNQTRNKKTGMGTPARIEVQKKLSIMRKENNFENPEYLNIKKYLIINEFKSM